MRHLGAAALSTRILFWWTESELLEWSGSIKYGVIGVRFELRLNGLHGAFSQPKSTSKIRADL